MIAIYNIISSTSGNMAFHYGPLTNSNITCSKISKTSIDMSGQIIKDVGTPVQPTDAANKEYVDFCLLNQSTSMQINLSSTTPVLISESIRYGCFRIAVMGGREGMPCATFEIGKSSFDRVDASIYKVVDNTIVDQNGQEEPTRLELTWYQNDFIRISKNTDNCDGMYIIRID